MSDESEHSADGVLGHVKWFDAAKGYGFVRTESVDSDILLHANVLRNFGQSSVSDGSVIRFHMIETRRGFQAIEILSIEAPPVTVDEQGAENAALDAEAGPLVAARVKWFDRAKGFGFANVFGKSDDVFIHMDVLRRSALSDLQPGEAVAIRVADGERGQLATQVSVWESANFSDPSSDSPSE
ncbi:cold shock domain-containing protein [Palleronia sp. LCG004]|uniref:cold-shock protein n=1 Tax=Palleronia sp. LCG004 TaxID=3079304 RepID=UPI002941C29B|nr:cold shock domain-containing protein [Palleronia sp. LCG004]WOI55242.1 cold shock domain-containing protein [Palleronia sp. LCG004]